MSEASRIFHFHNQINNGSHSWLGQAFSLLWTNQNFFSGRPSIQITKIKFVSKWPLYYTILQINSYINVILVEHVWIVTSIRLLHLHIYTNQVWRSKDYYLTRYLTCPKALTSSKIKNLWPRLRFSIKNCITKYLSIQNW